MIQYTDQITPEEYMELRKKVGWVEFPIEEAKAKTAEIVAGAKAGKKM